MPWHHIIPKHEWKRRFGNLKGVNIRDNLVKLTLEQHIQVHERMAEDGSKFDRIAYLAMSGMIGKEEAYLRAVSQPKSKGHCEAIRRSLLGMRHTPERVEKNRVGHLTQTFSEGHRIKISRANRGRPKPKVTCPHCGKVGGCNVMPRYHFNNCKGVTPWR